MFNFSSSSLVPSSLTGSNNNNRMYSSTTSNSSTSQQQQPQQQQQATIHTSYRCDGCSTEPIVGVRYHCATCGNFDYCEGCFRMKKNTSHPSFHSFVTHGRGVSPPLNNSNSSTTTNSIQQPPPSNLSSSVNVNNQTRYNNSNMLTNNPMINSTSNVPMSNSMVYQPFNHQPQQPTISTSVYQVPNTANNNIYQPPYQVQRSNPPPPTYTPFSNVGSSSVTPSNIPMTTSSITQSPLTSSTLSSSVKIVPTSTKPTNTSTTSINNTNSGAEKEKECHCCSSLITSNVHQCVTCFELTPSEDYCLCKDCHENFKQFGAENPIHLSGHTFQHFVDVKHMSIWKKTKGLENSKKQSSDKFGELEKLEIEEDHLLCVICNEKLRNIVFLECKHCVCCHECVDQLKKVDKKKECPMCRTVSDHIKIIWA